MEKAILKTLIYSDIFDYPLNIFEIHKWLIGKKCTLRQVEKSLKSLKRRAGFKKGYFFFKRRENIFIKRIKRQKVSLLYIRKVRVVSFFLKIIPWIKLVGVSGGLAMENAGWGDDIDLLIITSKNRLWLSRFLALGMLDFLGVRRKANMKSSMVSGKICCNILLSEDNLTQDRHDIYTAHEVLQMKVLWERDGVYTKYLSDNEWVFRFLPNWVGSEASLRGAKRQSNLRKEIAAPGESPDGLSSGLAMTIEELAKRFQLHIMKTPQGKERIQEGALYFHPNDVREKILKEFKKRISRL